MLAIFKKEFLGYFYSPIGYIFVGVFLLLSSIFYTLIVLFGQTANMNYVFSNTNIIMLFLIPILTMKLISEEKNKKTDQLLLTAPVHVSEIVLGKFFAALSVFGATLVLSLIYPAIMFMYAKPAIGEIAGAYIGVALLWVAFISIGLFVSSFTESQIIAAIFSFGSLLVLYVWDAIVSLIQQPTIAKAAGWFSLTKRYSNMQLGLLSAEDVVFYLSIIVIFIILTISNIEKQRYK